MSLVEGGVRMDMVCTADSAGVMVSRLCEVGVDSVAKQFCLRLINKDD